MVILGIDYGDVRTGISVCDKSETLASPVCVIKEHNPLRLIDEIKKIIGEYSPALLVLGLPKNMDGTVGFRGEKCLELCEMLKNETGLDCVLQDERLTTVSAHNYLSANNVRGKKRKAVVDEVASTIILQSFLDKRKNER